MASTISLSPCTTCRMPSGAPASSINSARRTGTLGSRSLGFRMKAFPQAIAMPNIHIGIIAGKLNGVMPAPMPIGWRMEKTSIPGPAPRLYSPFKACGMPQANSTTSRPRWMSPRESASTLPCSEERSRARLSISASTSSLKRNMTRARRCGLVAAQPGCAACAAATARSRSAREPSRTSACTSPLLGSNTRPVRPPAGASSARATTWSMKRIGSLSSQARRLLAVCL